MQLVDVTVYYLEMLTPSERTVAAPRDGLIVLHARTPSVPYYQFADKCHHAKEEDLFFPLLKERGIPEEGGPIGVMLHEHDVGRDCVRRMREASEGDEFDGAKFATAAKEFIPLLRQHIFKENNILFKMAGNVMSEADDADMDTKFTQVEQERDLAGMHKRYDAEVARWEEELT